MSALALNHYVKTPRKVALRLLERADLKPRKLTAHRDYTFTAMYHRQDLDSVLDAEERLESIDYRIVILKRPAETLDQGEYVTQRFALVNPQALDLPAPLVSINGAAPDPYQRTLHELRQISLDMEQLTNYAHELAYNNNFTHKHLTVALEELKNQIIMLNDGLEQLADQKTASNGASSGAN